MRSTTFWHSSGAKTSTLNITTNVAIVRTRRGFCQCWNVNIQRGASYYPGGGRGTIPSSAGLDCIYTHICREYISKMNIIQACDVLIQNELVVTRVG